ncbi:MAG TPA: flagellar basal body rod protein FlgB [candidate division Zixibacteria bacterium]|nr:flagellar basal body rod protein FlgB [candidate division Zixibacteria bacterium]
MAGLRLFSFSQQLLELSARLRAARHEILSANVANADTPGYRPRDLDFGSILRAAAEGDPSAGGETGRAAEGPSAPRVDWRAAIYEPEYPDNRHGEARLDRNSVGIDRQMALLAENALAYEANLTLLSRTLAALRFAISEGRR